MEYINIISLIASVITILALWGNLSAMFYNCKHFWNGGYRVTYNSKAYIIKKGNINGNIIYKSSSNQEDYYQYTEMGRSLNYEKIKPFRKWNMFHWTDDIRVPNYPLQLL